MCDQLLAALEDVAENKESTGSLRLVYKKLGPIEAKLIAEAISNNTHITKLRLDSNKFGDRGAQILAKALETNTTILALNLGTNEICTDGILSLADMLRKNQTLQSLFIDHNFIDHIGCKAIAESLKTNNALKVLNMGSTKLLPSGIEALGKALLRNTSLQCLHLAHTGIGNAGASDIGEALKQNCTLKVLDLTDCGIGKEGVASIVEGIKVNAKAQITTLLLQHNPIPAELVSKIEKLLELLNKQRKTAKLKQVELSPDAPREKLAVQKLPPSIPKQTTPKSARKATNGSIIHKYTSTTVETVEILSDPYADTKKTVLSPRSKVNPEQLDIPRIPSIMRDKEKDSTKLINYTTTRTTTVSVITIPGKSANLGIQKKENTDDEFSYLGTSPTDDVRLPASLEVEDFGD